METLPVEVKAMVLASIEDQQSLISLAQTDKTFYDIYKQDEAKLYTNLCYQKIGDELMPLALAVANSRSLLCSRQSYGQPQCRLSATTNESITAFVNCHFPQKTKDRHMDPKYSMKLLSFYDVADTYAPALAQLALQSAPGGHTSMDCTESEISRIRKSLYIMELLSNIFPRNHSSPASVAMPQEAALYPAWSHLLSKFAPWELQQVRCTKDVLAQHVQNVIWSDAAAKGQKQLAADFRLLRSFVSNEGLSCLSELEGLRNDCSTGEAVKKFLGLSQSWSASDSWFGTHDGIWLQQGQGAPIIDFGVVPDVLARYPEADSGPRDAWLHTLLQTHADEDMFDAGSRDCFKCDHHAAGWGYAYWDRQRLELIARGTLPTTEEMLSTCNIQLPAEEFFFYAKFRKERMCKCRRYNV